MVTPLAQYVAQIVRDDRMVEAQAARRRRLARRAARDASAPDGPPAPRRSAKAATANA
jgi:hypothetical protein